MLQCPNALMSLQGSVNAQQCVCADGSVMSASSECEACDPQMKLFCFNGKRHQCTDPRRLSCGVGEYLSPCSTSQNTMCRGCAADGLIPMHSIAVPPAGTCNSWECASGFFRAVSASNATAHASGAACLPCTVAGCPFGFHRVGCESPGAIMDAVCVRCFVPAHAYLLPDVSENQAQQGSDTNVAGGGATSTQQCRVKCKRGFWLHTMGAEGTQMCCSDAAYAVGMQMSPAALGTGGSTVQSVCQCLPGWVGNGEQCNV